MRQRRGFTVLEMLVTAVLMVLFLTLAWQVMLPGLRVWRVNQAQATLEENALVTTTSLVRDMERSTSASLTAEPTNGDPSNLQAISFATVGDEGSPDSYDPATGLPIWQSFVIYFVAPGSHILTRKVWPVAWLTPSAQTPPEAAFGAPAPAGSLPYIMPTNQPKPLAAADLATLCQIPNGTERQLSTCVDTFRVDPVLKQASSAVLTLDLSTATPFGVQNHITTTHRTQQFHFWL